MSLSIFLLPLEPSSLIWMCCFDNWGRFSNKINKTYFKKTITQTQL